MTRWLFLIVSTVMMILMMTSIFFCEAMQLRKHDQRTEPSKDEESVVAMDTDTTTNITHASKGCGNASMTCVTFASVRTDLPVRCGTLVNVPLCRSNQGECNVFCDADGGSRLCSMAFKDCCQQSKNGCISSQPLQVHLFL